MSNTPSADRRQHQRYPLATSVQFYHGPSQREFPGRCIDISHGGMLMYVPATVPVHPGQTVRLNVGNVHLPEITELTDEPIHATIVRVDRQALLTKGHIAVGMRFDNRH